MSRDSIGVYQDIIDTGSPDSATCPAQHMLKSVQIWSCKVQHCIE